MDNDSLVNNAKLLIDELASLLRKMSDEQIVELLGSGAINTLLLAIFDPSDRGNYPSLNEFLLANKGRATLVALLRYAITQNYSFKAVNKDGVVGYISPSHIQWFEDGVMFLQGQNRFEGLIGLYQSGERLSYAILARDAKAGEIMGPEYFEFVRIEEFQQRLTQVPVEDISNLDAPIQELEKLLLSQDNDESKYQELLIRYPWILGAEYRSVHRHTKLDDKNIPDFTGVRIRDGCRDIIEVKPPFTKMFRDDGNLNSDFNDAWNQAERYLDFARTERSYLQRKGLRFDNPKCYLPSSAP